MSGLRATQASLSLVGSNVANAETPGYTKKTVNQVAGTTGEFGSSVLINGKSVGVGDMLDKDLLVRAIRPDEIEFVFRGIIFARRF